MKPVRLGTHELLVRLAAGGAANVFLVRDLASPNQDQLRALKILLPSLASNQDFLNMFFTEARIASRLSHENIVAITGFGQVDGIHCLAMEYVFGASLAQVLRASARAKKPLTVGVLLRITASVCDALHFAHEMTDDQGQPMGLVHRDVTPQNILIDFEGIPKLTDFGIAKATGRGWETQAGIVKGKFSYMSPEQALGKKVDRRSDIFGTGIVLWEALTGRDLFKGSTAMDVLTAIREQKIEPPSQVVPGLTPIVDPIVMRALRRAPRQRYQTAAEMRDDILDLIRRAGVEIDAKTISQEFYGIYGEDINARAVELKKAKLGKPDLEALARVLGGQPLSSTQLPVVPGGKSDPDPLGLFSQEQRAALSDDVNRSDFEIVDVASDEPPSYLEEGQTRWEQAQIDERPQDDLLSMLSEEDATVGHVPQAFVERFNQAAKNDEPFPAGSARPRGMPIPPSRHEDWSAPSAYYDAPPRSPVSSSPRSDGASTRSSSALTGTDTAPSPSRPVPRAPSLDLEALQDQSVDVLPPFEDATAARPDGQPGGGPPSPDAASASSSPGAASGLGEVAIPSATALPRPRPSPHEAGGVHLSWAALAIGAALILAAGYALGLLFPYPI